MLDLVDVLHTDEQHGWSVWQRPLPFNVTDAAGAYNSVGHTFDAGDLVRPFAWVRSSPDGHDVDAVAGGERVVHGLFDAGRSGGDGGDQGHADEQGRACSCDASRILLYVGVRDRSRTARSSEANAPAPFMRAGSQKTAVSTMPRNTSAAPAMAIEHRHREFDRCLQPSVRRWWLVRARLENTAMAIPDHDHQNAENGSRTMPARLGCQSVRSGAGPPAGSPRWRNVRSRGLRAWS